MSTAIAMARMNHNAYNETIFRIKRRTIMTIADVMNEATHLDKEIKLLTYEVEHFGVTEDTEARLLILIGKHIELRIAAIELRSGSNGKA